MLESYEPELYIFVVDPTPSRFLAIVWLCLLGCAVWAQQPCICSSNGEGSEAVTFSLGNAYYLCATKDYTDPATKKPVFVSPVLLKCGTDSIVMMFSEKDNYFVTATKAGLSVTSLTRIPQPPSWKYRGTPYKIYRFSLGRENALVADSQYTFTAPVVPKAALDTVFARYAVWADSLECAEADEDECPYYTAPGAIMYLFMYAAVNGNGRAEEALYNASVRFSLVDGELLDAYKDIIKLYTVLKRSRK